VRSRPDSRAIRGARIPRFEPSSLAAAGEHELAALDSGDFDVEALADALAIRLSPVVPSPVRVVADGAMLFLRDPDGWGIGIDIAFHSSFPEAAPVPTACAPPPRPLERVQTNSPW
jgi:hypothetical protein